MSSDASKEGVAVPPSTEDTSKTEDDKIEGIFPIFFTGASQEIYGCKVDVDVTPENPKKLIPIEVILKDFKDRAAVCDFHPCKAQMTEYKGTEVLAVYDPDFKYGQNFFIFLTEETKMAFLQREIDAAKAVEEAVKVEQEVQQEVAKVQRERGWVHLGSDTEIQEWHIAPSRPLLRVDMTRRRRYFGAPTFFDDSYVKTKKASMAAPNLMNSIKSVPADPEAETLYRACLDRAVQAIPELSTKDTQTLWAQPRNAAAQYSVLQDISSTAGLTEFLHKALPKVEHYLTENETMRLFDLDYKLLRNLADGMVLTNKEESKLKEFQSFTYVKFGGKKAITCIAWHPKLYGVLSAAYSSRMSFNERLALGEDRAAEKSLVLIWNFKDMISPQLILEAPDDICSLSFSPSNNNVLAGGCVNGQVVLWDLSEHAAILELGRDTKATRDTPLLGAVLDDDKKAQQVPVVRYVAVSSIEQGHRASVTDILWFPPQFEIGKNGSVGPITFKQACQLASTACDGSVLVWDTRIEGVEKPLKTLDLIWHPYMKVHLAGDVLHGATRFSFRERPYEGDFAGLRGKGNGLSGSQRPAVMKPEDVSTKLFVGTERGNVLFLDWKPPETEGGKLGVQQILHIYEPHSSAVTCVEHSPWFPDIVLTIGGASFSLIKEGETDGPILHSVSPSASLTCGGWSHSRPGVFFIGKSDGTIEVWDLLDSSYRPALVQGLSSPAAITSLQCRMAKLRSKTLHYLAAGDDLGCLRIMELPLSVVQGPQNEVSIIESFFEREGARINYFDSRHKAAVTHRLSTINISSITDVREEMNPEHIDELEKAFSNEQTVFMLQMELAAPPETTTEE